MAECVYQPEDEKKIDYKLDEFRKKNKIRKNYFKNNIDSYKKHFNINIEEIKSGDEDTNYNIPFLVEPIMGMMFRNFKVNPLVDGRRNKNNIPIDQIIDYNSKILEDIEKLPIDMKYNIKNTSTYEFNYILNEVVPIILDKFSILFSLIISESSVSAGNEYVDLIDALDSWIMNFLKHSIEAEKCRQYANKNNIPIINIDNYGNLNFEKDSTYIIDKILKDEYKYNLSKTKCLKETLKDKGTKNLFEYLEYKSRKKTMDKSKIDREKLIKWINNEEDSDVYKYEKLLSDREEYLEDVKNKLNINLNKINSNVAENIKQKTIEEIELVIHDELETLHKNISEPEEFINKIDNILGGEKYDYHTIFLYNKIKEIVNYEEYKVMVSKDHNISDEDYDRFDKVVKKLAIDLWEGVYKEYYEDIEQIDNILNSKYDELRENKSQLNLIRTYLSKAMGQTITPILQKEIEELSKDNNEK